MGEHPGIVLTVARFTSASKPAAGGLAKDDVAVQRFVTQTLKSGDGSVKYEETTATGRGVRHQGARERQEPGRGGAVGADEDAAGGEERLPGAGPRGELPGNAGVLDDGVRARRAAYNTRGDWV
ncbi:hypothetical protein ACP70R_033801 [Stipagrostis hirtigluma subsp. patula]